MVRGLREHRSRAQLGVDRPNASSDSGTGRVDDFHYRLEPLQRLQSQRRNLLLASGRLGAANPLFVSARTSRTVARRRQTGSPLPHPRNPEPIASVDNVMAFDAIHNFCGEHARSVPGPRSMPVCGSLVSGMRRPDLYPRIQSNFSSDPHWTTDQPNNYYWDSANHAYHATTVNAQSLDAEPICLHPCQLQRRVDET